MDSVTDLLDASRKLQQQFEASTSIEHRRSRGQFFTPKPVCCFMARLLSRPSTHFRLLDPGAGVGGLTAAVCEEFRRLKSPRHLEIHLFENDPNVLDLLAENMAACRCWMETAGHSMDYHIHREDFVAVAGREFRGSRDLFEQESALGPFDAVIMNPPYFKIGKKSRHARLMASIVHGQPNIYALFLALAAHLLRPGGELVAITPRSFCNGLYFRSFRKWFFRRMSLEHIHLFESRTETFKEFGVLQENVITLARRSVEQAPAIRISTSCGSEFPEASSFQVLPAAKVIDRSARDYLIRVPISSQDTEIGDLMESLPLRFVETGLCISTGPVVMFRAKEYLIEDPRGRDTVPLLLPHNVKRFDTVWPVTKRGKPAAFRLCAASRRLVLPVRNYVLVKRFTAKEELRRLTASCFLGSRQSQPHVALENHLNYIYHGDRELSDEETYGIAALLNSMVFDRYFRMLSGSTQVNATELRSMKFPPLKLVEQLGDRVLRASPIDEETLEELVRETLAAAAPPSRTLTESVG